MKRIFHAAVALGALLALPAAPATGAPLFKGWWIVVGSYPPEPWQRQADDVARVHAAAKPCGVTPFNDLSEKFKGFSRGLHVFAIGAYASRAQAETVLQKTKPCFPGAYLKQAEHLGE